MISLYWFKVIQLLTHIPPRIVIVELKSEIGGCELHLFFRSLLFYYSIGLFFKLMNPFIFIYKLTVMQSFYSYR